ncbi:GNAT family N-acetyltransferase [Bowdeniella massiliensis]|uniref:GNAT family N-acetyltransferase n=1 Tax=Bowdeniella massiliensis TaxID=2932264 RepID=UPI0020289C1F
MISSYEEAAAHWPNIAEATTRWAGHRVFSLDGPTPSFILLPTDPERGDVLVVGERSPELIESYLPEDVHFVMAEAREDHADDEVLRAAGFLPIGDWWWMACRTPIAHQAGQERVAPLTLSPEEIRDAQSRCNPDTHVQSDDPAYQWWGYEAPDGVIAGIVAVQDLPEHLVGGEAGISLSALGVDPAYRRQGIAAAMMATLTNYGLTRGAVVQCGVWKSNEPALRIYRRLGYREEHAIRGWRRM